jgi:UDPglucose--hexose-1-phosphate uridylyltransferase
MEPIGAHEIIVETPEHWRQLAQLFDEEIAHVLEAYALRIADLKRDARFKYIAVFKNQGQRAGEDWEHPHSQVTATTFVPRRILYELRSAREWYRDRERCVFCDIMRQEIRQKKRIVDNVGDYYAFCPYASRVPYEIWLIPRTHNHQFEILAPGENRRHLATLLGRTLRRLLRVSSNYHMVLHTAPNTLQTKGELSDYWRTIGGDYHWHIEILPIVEERSKSYSIKEVYFNATFPEQAAEHLRQLDPGT